MCIRDSDQHYAAVRVELLERLGNSQADDATPDHDVGKHHSTSLSRCWVSGMTRVVISASPETEAVARNATSKDAASVSAPATRGPRKAPASEAIWKAATGVPPRPPMTSPTTAAEDTPSSAEPAPYSAIPVRN